MAAFSTLAVSNRSPAGTGGINVATLTFNAAAIDVTAYQLKQLNAVIQKLMVESSPNEGVSASTAAITGI